MDRQNTDEDGQTKHGRRRTDKTRTNTNGLGQTKQGPSVFCKSVTVRVLSGRTRTDRTRTHIGQLKHGQKKRKCSQIERKIILLRL